MNTMKKCSTCGNLYEGDLCPRCVAGFAQSPTNPTAPPEELPLKPGETFRGLEILQLLGRGGMGVVYKARQPALDRFVALKILPKRMAQDPDFQSRFIREAKALASLSHPNIVAVYDFGAEAGLFFFAMEFVDGTNLRQILREKTLNPEQALKIVPQLCDALEFAHAEGVVHRDIKPENILLDKKGRVKIADFGLAKLTGADSQHHMLTMTNMVMGTPHYMAPEQVENPKGVDHRADIYAIGVVFYEMLTGELPIGRFDLPSKKVQIDVRLDEVVLKALEKAPDRRYQKAGEVRDAVTRVTSVATSDAYPPTVMTPRPEKRSKAPFALIAAGLLVLGLCVGLLIKKGPTAPPQPADTKVSGPIDLSPLHFAPEERPGGYIWAPADKVLAKNPLPAKTPEELGHLVTYLAAIGLANVSPADLKQGYAAIWYRGVTGFIALETPVAERLEREFLALDENFSYRWTHRKGALLVLAWASASNDRLSYNQLVGYAQKKLGLPVEPVPLSLADLKFTREDVPNGWTIEERSDFLGQAVPGTSDAWKACFHKGENAPAISMGLFAFKDAKDAEGVEKTLKALPGARRVDVYRVGAVIAAIAHTGKELEAFAKFGEKLRDRMGLETWTFERFLPHPAELPEGFAIDQVRTDPASLIQEVGLAKIRPSEIARAWRASFKPAGTAMILEVRDDDLRSDVESQLRKVGPGWRMSNFVFSVEGPDDETLDALENFFREKCGWDANQPRPLKLTHLKRLSLPELPKGFELGPWTVADKGGSWELKTPAGPLVATALEVPNYQELRRLQQSVAGPGDLLLTQNLVLLHVKAGEAAWEALDVLEPLFRKKMRMGPGTIEELPEGYRKGTQWTRLWSDVSRERAQIRKLAELVGLDPARVAAVRTDRADPDALLFELKAPFAEAPAPKAGWSFVAGRGRFLAALAEPVDPAEREAVRGILRARK